jgi:hypothetical protein
MNILKTLNVSQVILTLKPFEWTFFPRKYRITAQDGSNLFVAECKFWHGASEMLKAISQLLSYLTWRDSKASLMLFVQNQGFTGVLNTISAEIVNHTQYKKSVGNRGESSFSFIFGLPQDPDKEVQLEVMAFHYDKK